MAVSYPELCVKRELSVSLRPEYFLKNYLATLDKLCILEALSSISTQISYHDRR
ncbi:hypothetical protein SAMN05216524_106526 [Mucilaginibacter sp. OK098]|nr:hypothetical protein SAMN05216524_106526 [Mucilaginibacter sp. OK098]